MKDQTLSNLLSNLKRNEKEREREREGDISRLIPYCLQGKCTICSRFSILHQNAFHEGF